MHLTNYNEYFSISMHKDLPHPCKWLQCTSLYGCIINTSDGYLGCIPFFHINHATINIFEHVFFLTFPIIRINFLEAELLVQKKYVSHFDPYCYSALQKSYSNLYFHVHCLSVVTAWMAMGITTNQSDRF